MSAKKRDNEKPRYALLPPIGERMAAEAMTSGATTYGDCNYLEGEGLAPERMLSAAYRHMASAKEVIIFGRGSIIDEDSGVNHLGCAIAELLMLAEVLHKRGEIEAMTEATLTELAQVAQDDGEYDVWNEEFSEAEGRWWQSNTWDCSVDGHIVEWTTPPSCAECGKKRPEEAEVWHEHGSKGKADWWEASHWSCSVGGHVVRQADPSKCIECGKVRQ